MRRISLVILLLFGASRLWAGELLDKAYAYDAWYQKWHSAGYGGTADAVFEDAKLTRLKFYDGIGDSTIWTGTYLGAEAFRYAVEKSPSALANARKAYQALHYHLLATGKPGLLARYLGPLEEPYWRGGEESCRNFYRCHIINCPEKPGIDAEKCFWLGEVSRDQYTGYWFGTALAYDLIDDPELKEWIRRDVREIINRMLKDNWVIIDVHGRKTDAGPEVMFAMKFAWLKIASHILNDPGLEKKYQEALARDWFWNILASDRRANQFFEYFAFNLDHQTYYNLIRLEEDRVRKRYLQKVFRDKVYSYTQNTDNVFFDYIAMAVLGERWEDTLKADERVLKLFPPPPNRLIEVSLELKPVWPASITLCKINYNLVKSLCRLNLADPKYLGGKLQYFYPVAKEPQSFEHKPKGDFIWQRPPNVLADVYHRNYQCSEMSRAHRELICTDLSAGVPRVPEELKEGFKVYPGVDYLIAYWMGRYYGFIGEEQ